MKREVINSDYEMRLVSLRELQSQTQEELDALLPHPVLPQMGKENIEFMNTVISSKVNVWQCDSLEARLQSADAKQERGRLVRAVMAGVGEL